MGQKVNPRGFRIGITENHHSTWFATSKNYKKNLQVDHLLRSQIISEFKEAPEFRDVKISKIEITRTVRYNLKQRLNNIDQVPVNIYSGILSKDKKINYILLQVYTPTPEEIYTRDSIVKKICSSIRKKCNDPIKIKFLESSDSKSNAKLIAESIGLDLEKRVNFRRAMKNAARDAKRANVKGIKIQIGGRLNGAEIARSEWLREGCVPLHTLRANIDYYSHEAHTTYGILGIKVWVFKGFHRRKK